MVARSGMFVAPLAGSPPTGMSPTDGRLAFSSLIGTVPQLASGGAITQSPSVMTITVAAAVWQLPDVSNAAGLTTFLSATDQFVLTPAAGPATGSRIDLIVVKQNNVENADADSRVNVILVAGTPGAPGVAPAVPGGGYLYATVTVPTSAANAAACTVVIARPSTFAPLTIKATTLILLNQITGVPAQRATVYADGPNNGDYVWGTNWVSTGDRYITATRSSSFTLSANSTNYLLTGAGGAGVFWGVPTASSALANTSTYNNELYSFAPTLGELSVKIAGTYEIELNVSATQTGSGGTTSIGIVKNTLGIGATTNDLARADAANTAVTSYMKARNPAVALLTTDIVRFVVLMSGVTGTVVIGNNPMDGTFRMRRIGA